MGDPEKNGLYWKILLNWMIWKFPEIGIPQIGWFRRENPKQKWTIGGTSILGNLHTMTLHRYGKCSHRWDIRKIDENRMTYPELTVVQKKGDLPCLCWWMVGYGSELKPFQKSQSLSMKVALGSALRRDIRGWDNSNPQSTVHFMTWSEHLLHRFQHLEQALCTILRQCHQTGGEWKRTDRHPNSAAMEMSTSRSNNTKQKRGCYPLVNIQKAIENGHL